MAAIFTFYPYNYPPSSSFLNSATSSTIHEKLTCNQLVVPAAHSNPRILKTNRKSRHGQPLSPYDIDDDDEELEDDDDDYWFSDGLCTKEEFAETLDFDVNDKKFKSRAIKEKDRNQVKDDGRSSNYGRSNKMPKSERVASLQLHSSRKFGRSLKDNKYPLLSEKIVLVAKWLPLLDYLSTFGIEESHFIQMYERHMPSLQINICSAQERLEYLFSVGVKHEDVKRILLRQPQILEYTVENNLKSHVAFLMDLGIPNSRVGQVIAAAPSLFSYSVENSLKPTLRYLVEQVGIKEEDLGKVVQLSPQILVQRIDFHWNTRYMFLNKELGAPRDIIVKMVTKHPQLLHYSIDDGLRPRINFLRSIGMQNSDILKVLTNLTQVLSLSLEKNLKPKYSYLVNELHNEVQSLTKYPVYFSLSLDQRIRPRHRFLVSLNKAPKGPFPLGSLVPTDECFCRQWAETSLDKYLAFRQRLLLRKFAEKYERKM